MPPALSAQVNTGNYRKAVELFRGLLSIRPGLVGAHLGLGSALALLGSMDNAVASFSAAIEVKHGPADSPADVLCSDKVNGYNERRMFSVARSLSALGCHWFHTRDSRDWALH